MTTQHLTTDVMDATIAAYAGYQVRWLPNERQWAVQNPGDLQDLFADFRAGKQSIADAQTLLRCYDNLLKKAGRPGTTVNESQLYAVPAMAEDGATILLPGTFDVDPEHTWVTADSRTANLLFYRGNELLNIRLEGNKVAFIFACDRALRATVSLFNQGRLRVEPRAFFQAGYRVRDVLKATKDAQRAPQPMSTGLSHADAEEVQ